MQPTPPPSRSAGLLTLINALFEYGSSLISALKQRPPFTQTHVGILAWQFGTPNIPLIAAHIVRGLQTIVALRARIIREAARLDRPSARMPPLPPLPRLAPLAGSRAPTRRRGATADEAALLQHPPTPEEIAARIRHLPIGTVIAGICADLGITAAHPFWQDLCWAIEDNGGKLTQPIRAERRRARCGPREFARDARNAHDARDARDARAQRAPGRHPGLAPAVAPIAAAATGPP